ncbi:hypothetical protein B0H13DRAFT_2316872 [Mycena leptocephala]|nr:hypothetical protein B0H13DRAFT_2316872 [Mycena leptocephala]
MGGSERQPLEELQKFCTIAFKFHNVKKKPFNDPNGHVPAIEVPHADLVLWESGAIIQHPIEQYDTDKTLTYTTLEKHRLHFQMSGWGRTGERALVQRPPPGEDLYHRAVRHSILTLP